DGIVEGNGIRFTGDDVVAVTGAARELIGGAGPDRLAAEPFIKLHQLAGTHDRLRVACLRTNIRIGEAHDAIIRPGGDGKPCPVSEEILREIDMRLAAIEAGIDMGEGDGNERAGAENFGS